MKSQKSKAQGPKEDWVKTVTEAFRPNAANPERKKLYIDAPKIEDVRRELNWMVQGEKAYPDGTIFLTRLIPPPHAGGYK